MLNPGTILSSRYKVESVLGQGGMGAVYLATMEALGGKKVAVKEMELKGFSADELAQAVKQFNKEASFLANLDHPNLVQVTDFFVESDKHYLVMAYVTGETLQQKLKRHGRPFGWEKVKTWADPLVEVLAYLHNQNPPILFRDLKPSNVMIEESGRLRLIDFGIARTAQAGDKTSTFLQGTGTSGFSPIEQYGGAQSTDKSSDIYALGATLYYLLTGKIPPDAVARISQGKELIPPTTLQSSLPEELDALLSQALALKQQDRHSSMEEFKAQMNAIQVLDTEAMTEDFGALPAVGESTKPAPVTKADTTKPATSIHVEMFPTNTGKQDNHSYTPWAIGFGSLAVCGVLLMGMVFKNFPGNNEKKGEVKTPPAEVRQVVENSKNPEPVNLSSEPEKKPKDSELTPTKPSRPKALPRPVVRQPVSPPKPKPKTRPKPKPRVAKKKPSIDGKAYPTATKKYPTAKPRVAKPKVEEPPKERIVVVRETPAAAKPSHQPGTVPAGFPTPPPGFPPPPIGPDGKPLPPGKWRPGGGPGGRGPHPRGGSNDSTSGIPGY